MQTNQADVQGPPQGSEDLVVAHENWAVVPSGLIRTWTPFNRVLIRVSILYYTDTRIAVQVADREMMEKGEKKSVYYIDDRNVGGQRFLIIFIDCIDWKTKIYHSVTRRFHIIYTVDSSACVLLHEKMNEGTRDTLDRYQS